MNNRNPRKNDHSVSESLLEKVRSIFPPGILWKFVLVGFVGFLTQYFVLSYIDRTLDVDITKWPFWLSVEAGIAITFILNDQWVFKTEYHNSMAMRFLSYEGTLFIGAIIQWILFVLFYTRVLLVGHRFWANAMAVFFATIWNYVIMKRYIFKGDENEDSNNGSRSAGKRSGSAALKEE